MRILHIGKFYPPEKGGIETATKSVVEYLWKSKRNCDVVCFSSKENEIFKCDQGAIYKFKSKLKLLSTPFSLSFLYFMVRHIHQYQAVHLHVPNPLSLLFLFFIRPNQKLIVHWHSDVVNQRRAYILYRPFEKMMLIRANTIVVGTTEYLNGSEPLIPHKEKAAIISYGAPKLNKEVLPKDKNNQVSILSVGRLVHYKGFEYLIRAAKDFADNVDLTIIGSGPEENKLKKLILDLNLKNVHIKNCVDDLSSYFENADIFCLPSISRAESFGIALIEAMSYKLPLITTDVTGSGMNYINVHEHTGLIVRKESPGELAEAINKIAASPELRKKYSENSYQRFLSEFDEEVVLPKFLPLYTNNR